MLSKNNTKQIDLSQISSPSLSDQNCSPKTVSTQISLDSKKFSQKNKKPNKPNTTPKIELSNNSSNESISPNYEIQLNSSNKDGESNGDKFNSGKWTDEEQENFIEGILKYGTEWKKVQQMIKTRSSDQARSHGQKFFIRIKKLLKNEEENNNLNSKEKTIDNILYQVLPKKYIKKLNKNQKAKLFSAISTNAKCEDSLNLNSKFDLGLEEEDGLKYKSISNDNNIIIKNSKISFDLNFLNVNDDIPFASNKVSIGKKRKANKKQSKKQDSRKSSFDFPFNKFKDKDNDDINFLNNLGFGDNLEYNRKSSISSNNVNIKQNGNLENKNNVIINNVINVTNNIINNNYVYNILTPELNNNNFNQDFFFNDKNDSINNEKNQFYFGNFPNQDKCTCNDKEFLIEKEFNKILDDNFKENNYKDNEIKDNENNNNERDPFQLNFNNFSEDNLINNENERQMTEHEINFI